jgi:putative FmdB family regulatory protein
MPIYAYRCAACGHAKDVLQKLSDPVLTQCPACSAEAFSKQLTAAGFQLKGSGWYVTDFRDGNKGAAKKDDAPDKPEAKPADQAADKPASDSAAAPAAAAPTSAGQPAAATPAATPPAGVKPAAAKPAAAPAPPASA